MIYKIIVASGSINGLNIRQTDCCWMYKSIMIRINKCRNNIKDLSPLELFEVIIRLNKKGLYDFKKYIFQYWECSKYNIWEIRKIKKTIKYLS